MFSPGNIIYFTPFYFKNGNASKPKYFIVLKKDQESTIIATLPTSKDHVPQFISKRHGCINEDTINFNCYMFIANTIITENSWAFPRDTYVYGQQIDLFDKTLLEEIYAVEEIDYKVMGKLTETEFRNLLNCIINSSSIKRKLRNLLSQ